MSESAARSGGCLCGAVRFSAQPASTQFGVCHCTMCRRWSAGPYLAIGCGEAVSFETRDHLGIYRSSPWAERGFCTKCGSSLFYRLIGTNHHYVSTEAFDEADDFVMASQVFIDEKPARYDFANQTRTMTASEVFAAVAKAQGAGDG